MGALIDLRYYARLTLSRRLSTPEGKRRFVGALFSTIADRYDFITVVLSYGQDRRWKRRLVDLARPEGDARALDLATGTGDIAYLLSERLPHVVGLDITRRMVELARVKAANGRAPAFLVGDMMSLPFSHSAFDVVTTGYGLRNVPEMPVAIDEIHRVLRDGGQLLSLDFNRPTNRLVREAYLRYLWIVGGVLGWLLHRDPETYRYIPASLRRHPDAYEMAALLRARGFSSVSSHLVLGGLMAIHRAVK
jgi:demethylmenaquinone methyltransferase/2-methoxy-6-polyprenyl-1,4-benzoquinol methylase